MSILLRRGMILWVVLPMILLSSKIPLFAASPIAAPSSLKNADAAFVAIHKEVLAALPSTDKSQVVLFEYLKDKSGREISLPDYPDDALLDWTREEWKAAGRDPQQLYPVIYGQLLVARKLLNDKSTPSQRRGLRVAHNARLVATMRIKDNALSSQIFDALILPYLSAAYPQGRSTLSRRRLLQDAASTYRLNQEADKQVVALRALVQVSANEKDVDGADWARAKLAETLASRDKPNDLSEGVQLLRAITSLNMTGTRDSMMKGFEQKLKEKREAYQKQQKESEQEQQ